MVHGPRIRALRGAARAGGLMSHRHATTPVEANEKRVAWTSVAGRAASGRRSFSAGEVPLCARHAQLWERLDDVESGLPLGALLNETDSPSRRRGGSVVPIRGCTVPIGRARHGCQCAKRVPSRSQGPSVGSSWYRSEWCALCRLHHAVRTGRVRPDGVSGGLAHHGEVGAGEVGTGEVGAGEVGP